MKPCANNSANISSYKSSLEATENFMPTDTLIFLAEISRDIGLIGIDEYEERISVALWLDDDPDTREDPRHPPISPEGAREGRGAEEGTSEGRPGSSPFSSAAANSTEPQVLEFIALNDWYFTGSDRDSYPAVPHGHYRNANRPWPKLNPYSGRVFSAKHTEDPGMRLSKQEMRTLWSDSGFRDHCRKQIMWYMQTFPYYRFSVRNPLKFPRW